MIDPLFLNIFPDVRAYIDPGVGSVIIQVLIGVFFGGIFLAKVF